ncbi:MAG TPA: HAD family hydrolase [Nocardioidaceae bacterium]|nr:HAD family hydrolase [Nocardioidaceae bacterium]
MADTAIFDVDGTLVDSNYHHTLAWFHAFRRFDLDRPMWRIHRAIGMGGDKLVAEVGGEDVEEALGHDLREAWVEEVDKTIHEVRPFEGARDLLEEVKRRGFSLVLASSGQPQHFEVFLDLVDARSLADAWTTSEDAEQTKPEPDLIETALAKVEGSSGVMVGDSVWDVVAASKLDVPTIAVLSGGFSIDELRTTGAAQVYESLVELRENLDDTALKAPGD